MKKIGKIGCGVSLGILGFKLVGALCGLALLVTLFIGMQQPDRTTPRRLIYSVRASTATPPITRAAMTFSEILARQSPTRAGKTTANVIEVVDGDTLAVRLDGQAVRVGLLLVAAPKPGDPYYAESVRDVDALLNGQVVTLAQDVSDIDAEGRLLRYVYLSDGRLANAEILRAGLAQLDTTKPDADELAKMRAAEQEAKFAGRGLWATLIPAMTQANRSDVAANATVNQTANLRAGPSTDYAIVGSANAGEALKVVGVNTAGDWYLLEDGKWIAAFLIDGAPDELPLVDELLAFPNLDVNP